MCRVVSSQDRRRLSADGFGRGTDAAWNHRAGAAGAARAGRLSLRLQPGRHRPRSSSTSSGEASASCNGQFTLPQQGGHRLVRQRLRHRHGQHTGSRSSRPSGAFLDQVGEPRRPGTASSSARRASPPTPRATSTSSTTTTTGSRSSRPRARFIAKWGSSGAGNGQFTAPGRRHRLLGQRLRRRHQQQPDPEVRLLGHLPHRMGKPRHRGRPVHLSFWRRHRLLGQRLRRRRRQQPDPEVRFLGRVHHQVGKRGHRGRPVRRGHHARRGDRLRRQRHRRRLDQQPDPEVPALGHLHHQMGEPRHRDRPVQRALRGGRPTPPTTSTSSTRPTTGSRSSTKQTPALRTPRSTPAPPAISNANVELRLLLRRNAAAIGFECRLDSSEWASCTSPKAYSSLSEGSHTFHVRAVDAGRKPRSNPAARTWTVDDTPPQTTIDSGPSGSPTTPRRRSASPPSPGRASSAASTPTQQADFGACTSPQPYSSLADGSHTFEVRATDPAGNTDPTPASRSFTVDTVAPETTIDSGPSGSHQRPHPDLRLLLRPGASFECRLDSTQEADFAACSSPQPYSSWPTAPTLRGPGHRPGGQPRPHSGVSQLHGRHRRPRNPDRLRSLRSHQRSDPELRLLLRTRRASSAASTRPRRPTSMPAARPALRPPGRWRPHVRGQGDRLGWQPRPHSGVSQLHGRHRRTRNPDPLGPAGPTNDPTPTFSFSSSEPGSHFACKVGSNPYVACSSPKTITRLTDGQHTFYVRATDAIGNVDPTPATHMIMVRTAAVHISGSTLVSRLPKGQGTVSGSPVPPLHPAGDRSRGGPLPGLRPQAWVGMHPPGRLHRELQRRRRHADPITAGVRADKVLNLTAIQSSLDGGGGDDVLIGGSSHGHPDRGDRAPTCSRG